MEFIYYPKCSTCQRALATLQNKGIHPSLRHIVEETPSKEEIQKLHEKSGLDIQKFFNTSGIKYKELNLKDKLKTMTLQEKYALLASDGMLLKRPLLINDNQVLVGSRHSIYKD